MNLVDAKIWRKFHSQTTTHISLHTFTAFDLPHNSSQCVGRRCPKTTTIRYCGRKRPVGTLPDKCDQLEVDHIYQVKHQPVFLLTLSKSFQSSIIYNEIQNFYQYLHVQIWKYQWMLWCICYVGQCRPLTHEFHTFFNGCLFTNQSMDHKGGGREMLDVTGATEADTLSSN